MDDVDAESSDHLTGRPSKLEDSTLDDDRRRCTAHKDDHAMVKPERPLGNRIAVKKYRAKKKAHNAYLEEEVKKLRAVNRGLIRKLQFQATLEAEAVRLRSLLMDLKAKIVENV
uniref:Basic leucine zipper 23-like n=1 Tax=Tanacetum cinerariifolium TaxID=118510 RepID=A0A6L2L818_TANCI|nr:basic leucine zipper 23-like [Tanacetum cinerariifolium]